MNSYYSSALIDKASIVGRRIANPSDREVDS